MTFHDTIAAIATAPGRGGVAVIRVSGPEAFAIAERLSAKAPRPGRIVFTAFYAAGGAESAAPACRRLLDEGLLLSFRAPHSYTGEDAVEFQVHGGTVTPRRMLEAALAVGARLARRGEFTERAFLNGKLALDQAEAVLDLVDAKTDRAADAALDDLVPARAQAAAGPESRERPLRDLYEKALDLSSTLEHALDIDEGELPEDFFTRLRASLADLEKGIEGALKRSRERALLRRGALVVLAGPPNAGKSSLLNALVGAERAIVSEVPGTTRDAVEAWLDLGGWPVRLVDTAGLRATDDAIEAEGVRRARSLMARADVVIELGRDIHPKCDLGRARGLLNVSAKTGEGLDALKRLIVARLEAKAARAAEESGEVEEARLLECRALLADGAFRGEGACDLVLAGNQLRRVAAKLGEELGVNYTDDLLERLFSRFCVGK